MTWREAIKIVAVDARTRAATVLGSPFNSLQEAKHTAQCLKWLAEHLDFVASLPPHEGLRELRKMGRQ